MGVCTACIEDPALQKVVEANLTDNLCDYCGRQEDAPIACELHIITEHMKEIIEEQFCDPVEELAVEGGEYVDEPLGAWELLAEINFGVDNPNLFDDIAAAFTDHEWCRKDYYSMSYAETHVYGWEHFCHTVKTQRRYTFWTAYDADHSEYDEQYFHPAQMLWRLAEIIRKNEKILDVGTLLWRVQVLDRDEEPKVPHRFTSPPVDRATIPNRMSPAGIPMFYGAVDINTAFEEVAGSDDCDGKAVWGIQFESVASLNLLDLTRLPNPPSYFSSRGYESQDEVQFLSFFRNDLVKPIERDGREHIDYVPTQVFTEYVRYEMKTISGGVFHGIVYPSSKTAKPCFVIFADQEQCLDGHGDAKKPQLLRGIPDSLKECEGGSNGDVNRGEVR